MNKWMSDAFFYHVYPLGLCGAPDKNDHALPAQNRLNVIQEWIPHIKTLGANAVYLGPLFESLSHGYDTTDYYTVDRRLGTNEALRDLINKFHESEIRVILDGVFNHVGRDFPKFRELTAEGEGSSAKNWFRSINFKNNNIYNDGFSYKSWGTEDIELVELNLENPEVVSHLLSGVKKWILGFDIDGIRVDAADCLDIEFIQQLRKHVRSLKDDFLLLGEVVHSEEYKKRMGIDKLDTVTNYEIYKGLYSSHNDKNYFEIAHSLNRLFGEHGLLKGSLPYNFLDNHDVSRIMSMIKQKEHIYPLHILLFTIPGIPSIYYGSEWGIQGIRKNDDKAVRPYINLSDMKDNDLSRFIASLAAARKGSPSLKAGDYRQVFVSSEVFAFMRRLGSEISVVVVNQSSGQKNVELKIEGEEAGEAYDLLAANKKYLIKNGLLQIALKGFYGAILSLKS